MFSNMVGMRLEKYNKKDINNYLNNKKQVHPSANTMKKMIESTPAISQPSLSQISSQTHPITKKNQYEIRAAIIQNLPPTSQIPLKIQKADSLSITKKTIAVIYIQGENRCKIQVIAENLSKNVQSNEAQGSIIVTAKKISKYRMDGVKPNQWMLLEEAKDKQITLTIIFKDKDVITKSTGSGPLLKKSVLDRLNQDQFSLKDSGTTVRLNPNLPGQGQPAEPRQPQDEHQGIRFLQPNQSQLNQTEKFRKNLRQMKQEDKVNILMDVFKIKKQYEDPMSLDRRKLKCPIFTCQKTHRDFAMLKTHLRKHPELIKHGIQLTDYGVFEYDQKALDLALALGKIYPGQMKKIIRMMKTKSISE